MQSELAQVFFWVTVILWVVGIAALLIGRRGGLTNQQQADLLVQWGDIFVGAAEQLYGDNQVKFNYAYDHLRALAAEIAPEIDEAEIRAVVEWAVRRLKANALGKIDWAAFEKVD